MSCCLICDKGKTPKITVTINSKEGTSTYLYEREGNSQDDLTLEVTTSYKGEKKAYWNEAKGNVFSGGVTSGSSVSDP